MNSQNGRVVALIDMDCFYVQVEQRMNPQIRGKPCAVVQYNGWKGGGIIAVGYEARAVGVSRQMRGDEAKEKCPEIHLCRVPTANGKADLTRYRDASAEVIKVLLQFGGLVERASIDEAYIDLTDTVANIVRLCTNTNKGNLERKPDENKLQFTHVVGFPTEDSPDVTENRLNGLREYMKVADSYVENMLDLRLLIAAKIVEEIRKAVYDQTTFRCSAGISYNKMLAKLACGINKPNKQTILPMSSVPGLFKTIKVGKIRNLGGKLGKSLMALYGIQFIGELTKFSSKVLEDEFGEKTGSWLYEVCRGQDSEVVKERHIAESVGCSKNFTGVNALNTRTQVKHWVEQLAKELVERLVKERDMNNRVTKGMTAHLGLKGKRGAVSRVCQLDRYDVKHVTNSCLSTIEQLNKNKDKNLNVWTPAINMIGLASKNFRPFDGNTILSSVAASSNPKVKDILKTSSGPIKVSKLEKEKSCIQPNNDSMVVVENHNLKPKDATVRGVSRFFKPASVNPFASMKPSQTNSNDMNVRKTQKRKSLESFFSKPQNNANCSSGISTLSPPKKTSKLLSKTAQFSAKKISEAASKYQSDNTDIIDDDDDDDDMSKYRLKSCESKKGASSGFFSASHEQKSAKIKAATPAGYSGEQNECKSNAGTSGSQIVFNLKKPDNPSHQHRHVTTTPPKNTMISHCDAAEQPQVKQFYRDSNGINRSEQQQQQQQRGGGGDDDGSSSLCKIDYYRLKSSQPNDALKSSLALVENAETSMKLTPYGGEPSCHQLSHHSARSDRSDNQEGSFGSIALDVSSDTSSMNEEAAPNKADIDMDVFESLPLSIQHELRRALGLGANHPASSQKGKSKANSIDKFLSQGVKKPSSKLTVNSQKKKSKVASPKFPATTRKEQNNPAVPFGFFRARSQVSEAIKKAVETRKFKSSEKAKHFQE